MHAVLCLALTACTTARIETVHGVQPLAGAVMASITLARFQTGTFTARDGTVLPYRLLTPLQMQPGRRYPLVVQFHGSGGIGNDNHGQLDNTAKAWDLPAVRTRHPAFVLLPQFTERSANYDDPQTPHSAHPGPQLDAALELVDAIMSGQPIDHDRIYATGFSMGGSATWLAVLARPQLFAAAMPVSAVAPERMRAGELKQLPLLVLHGDADTENPIDSDRAMVTAIGAAGGRRIRMRVYAGLAHRPPADLVPGDWWRDWLFTQHRNP